MSPRNPILIANSNSAALAKAETTIVAQLPTVLGKVTIPINGQMLTTVQIVALVQGLHELLRREYVQSVEDAA